MHNEIKIIHLSDFHFGQTSLYLSDFFSKRITGYVNLKRHRSKHFPIGLKNKIIQKVEQTSYDYLFITGDLTNLARESEFAEARERLDPILKKGKTIWKEFKGIKEGGFVSGPGSETSDSIPARLSDGEFVVKASAVRGLGKQLGAKDKGEERPFSRPDPNSSKGITES